MSESGGMKCHVLFRVALYWSRHSIVEIEYPPSVWKLKSDIVDMGYDEVEYDIHVRSVLMKK